MTDGLERVSTRLCLGVVLAFGSPACGGQTSLDLGIGTSGSTTVNSTGIEQTQSTGVPEPPLVICDPDCAPLLLSTWSYDGEAGTRMVVEMRRDTDGSILLGTQRSDGTSVLTRLTPDGEWLWSATPSLADTEIEFEGFDLHPSGDLILSATARATPPQMGGGFNPDLAVLARFDVTANELAWTRSSRLDPGLGTRPRAGQPIVLDDDVIVHLNLNGYSEGELLGLREYDAEGTLRVGGTLTNQPGTGDGWLPLAVQSPTGELLIAHHWWDSPAQRMSAATWRMVPPVYIPLSVTEVGLAIDELAVDSIGRRVELAHGRSDETVTLLLSSWRSSGAVRWETSLPIITTSSARPALAVGPDDDVYIAARATPRPNPIEPYVVLLEIARWSSDGELRWQSRRPLDMMATDDPVELVIDDDDGVIVGTVLSGRVHVERYEQACACR